MKQLSLLGMTTPTDTKPAEKKISLWKLFVDGASRNNPGPSGAGVYLLKNSKVVVQQGFYLDKKTNNQAEYLALLLGLFYFKEHAIESNELISIYSDSQLMISQLTGVYRVKNSTLQNYYRVAHQQLEQYNYALHHVLRHNNTKADALANLGVDKKITLPQAFTDMMHSHGIEL